MFQILTIVIAILSIVIAFLTYPLLGWTLLCLIDLFISYEWRALRNKYRFHFTPALSAQANILLQSYAHYFIRQKASKDFSASAAAVRFAGIALVVACFLNRSYGWPIAFGAINWFVMGEVAAALSPGSKLSKNPALQKAYDEVIQFMGGSSAADWREESRFNNKEMGTA